MAWSLILVYSKSFTTRFSEKISSKSAYLDGTMIGALLVFKKAI